MLEIVLLKIIFNGIIFPEASSSKKNFSRVIYYGNRKRVQHCTGTRTIVYYNYKIEFIKKFVRRPRNDMMPFRTKTIKTQRIVKHNLYLLSVLIPRFVASTERGVLREV